MKKVLIILLLFQISVNALAQEKDTTTFRKSWVNQFLLGGQFSENRRLDFRPNISWMSGVQISKEWTAGAELEFSDYDIFDVASLSGYGSRRLRESINGSFVYGKVGYGFLPYSSHSINAPKSKGGILLGTGFGMEYPVGRVSIIIRVGYKHQQIKHEERSYHYFGIKRPIDTKPIEKNPYERTIITRKMHRIELIFGFRF